MTSRPSLLLLAAVLVATPGVAVRPASPTVLAPPSGCTDFLLMARRKPPQLRFGGCRYRPEGQGKPLRATYSVAGASAAAVETALVRSAGLKRLKRSCCQWDSAGGSFKDASGRYYSVIMVSEETAVARRSDWRRIPTFAVIVETFTEEV